MTNHVSQFIELHEVNRIIQGLSKAANKSPDHVNSLWRETDKEVILKHQGGVTDHYKEIGKIVRAKLGLKGTPVDGMEDEDDNKKSE